MWHAWLMPTVTASLNRCVCAVACDASALRAWTSGSAWVLHRAVVLCRWVGQQSCAFVCGQQSSNLGIFCAQPCICLVLQLTACQILDCQPNRLLCYPMAGNHHTITAAPWCRLVLLFWRSMQAAPAAAWAPSKAPAVLASRM